MSFANLQDLSYFSLAGFTLNIEERTVLESSLQIKKDQEKLSAISFWGKILAIQRDYYIAQSVSGTWFDRKYYYSLDLVNWLQLPEVTPTEAKRIDQLQGKFNGDASFEYTVTKVGDEPDLKPDEKVIKEEKRLARVVALINYESQIVPRGAYYKDATSKLSVNPHFSGLDKEQVTDLNNYFHFREGYEADAAKIAEKINTFDENIDIFEPISNDIPQGSWSLQAEKGGSVAILRNLTWPGYVFYHAPAANKFGGIYFGYGQKNTFLGYML